MAASVRGVEGQPAHLPRRQALPRQIPGHGVAQDALQPLFDGEAVFPGTQKGVAGAAPDVQHIFGKGVIALLLGDNAIGGHDKGGGAVAGIALGVAPGRPRAAVAGDDQHLVGGAGGHSIQGLPQGGDAGAERVGDVGGENIAAQIQGRGDDRGAALFGVGRRGGGEKQPVHPPPVAPGQAIPPRRHRHSDAILVEVSYRPLRPRPPTLGPGAQTVAGHIAPKGRDSSHNTLR